LSKLISDATEPVDKKIETLKEQLATTQKILKKMEEGFKAEYQLFIDSLEKEGIKIAWPQHDMKSEVSVMNSHEALTNLVDSVAGTASGIVENLVNDQGTSKQVKSAMTSLSGNISDAMKVFLASSSGKENSVSRNIYIVQGLSIQLVYLQSYNITLQAGALDGEQKIGAYIYLVNSGDVNLFDTNNKLLITKLAESTDMSVPEAIEALQKVYLAQQELDAMSDDKPSLMSVLKPDAQPIKRKLDAMSEDKRSSMSFLKPDAQPKKRTKAEYQVKLAELHEMHTDHKGAKCIK